MARTPQLDKNLTTMLQQLPPLQRLTEAVSMMDRHRAAIGELARIRAAAARELVDGGMSVIAIADAVGVTRQEIYRLLKENS